MQCYLLCIMLQVIRIHDNLNFWTGNEKRGLFLNIICIAEPPNNGQSFLSTTERFPFFGG